MSDVPAISMVGHELVSRLNIRNSVIELVVQTLVTTIVNRLIGGLNHTTANVLEKSACQATRFLARMYQRIRSTVFASPCDQLMYTASYSEGSTYYYAIVRALINDYHATFQHPIIFTATGPSISIENLPTLAMGEHTSIIYHDTKIVIKIVEIKQQVSVPSSSTTTPNSGTIQFVTTTVMSPTMMLSTSKPRILEEFTREAHRAYVAQVNGGSQVYVYRPKYWMITRTIAPRDPSTVILQGNMMDQILEQVNFFSDNRQWYIAHGIPYKLGLMFHGPPGTGKTSMINIIATTLHRDIYYLILDSIDSDDAFITCITAVPDTALLVIEDIDRMRFIQGDKSYPSSSESSGVTMATFLNVMDGFLSKEGRIVILTANHPEEINPVIVRPGRIDYSYQLGPCDRSQISRLYQLVFDRSCPEGLLDRITPECHTPAEILGHLTQNVHTPERVFDEEFLKNNT
uniref:AAA+ ATPase domain-containing protein n=1 Tax=viral metagenome TaxID=1070528 RepID=A0A6C0BKW8_9ZZZZ